MKMERVDIEYLGKRSHSKASETYIDVRFNYDKISLETSVPIEYRRTGTFIEEKDEEEYICNVYDKLNPKNWENWRKEQVKFWETKPNASTTKPFFDKLSEDFKYKCVYCELPQNPNWARRIQDLKEFGYTIGTKLSEYCPHCKKNTTHLVLLPLARGGITGYETWSPELRKRIVKLLNGYDVFEAA